MTPERPRRSRLRVVLLVVAVAWLGMALWHVLKPLPAGMHVTGPWVTVQDSQVQFLADVTTADAWGMRQQRRQIHAATLELVHEARDLLVLDYFLFNDQGGPAGPLRYDDGLSPVAGELVDALRALRQARPDLPVLVITDPINDYYRGDVPPALAALRTLGIDVVATPLEPLRDSNPLYSATWRLLVGWWLDSDGTGRWRNLLDAAGPRVTFGALSRIPHFKANHRKLVITGDGAGSLRGIVSSANPHDASSAHSNVALYLAGEALRPLLQSELALARLAGWHDARFDTLDGTATHDDAAAAPAGIRTAVVTEGAIRDTLLARLSAAAPGDAIDIAQFYFSDRAVIEALRAAAQRGVAVRVLLDPNKDAFGFEKSGIPNRQVASELIAATDGAIALRWYRTHGEQFHAKLALVRSGNRVWATLGSANFTRRNLGDYNLEANALLDAPADSQVAMQMQAWFEMLWNNRPAGQEYSADAELYAEASLPRYWLYRVMEASGLSTF